MSTLIINVFSERRENKALKLTLPLFSCHIFIKKSECGKNVFISPICAVSQGRFFFWIYSEQQLFDLCFIRSYNHRNMAQNKFVDPGRDDEWREIAVWCGCYWWQTLCNWRSNGLKTLNTVECYSPKASRPGLFYHQCQHIDMV